MVDDTELSSKKENGLMSEEKQMINGSPTNANGTDLEAVKIQDGSTEKSEEPVNKVGFFGLFRYATWLDILFMVSGSIAAIAHGAGWPVLNIFFGEMVDGFIDYETVLPPPGEPVPTAVYNNLSQFKEDFNDMSRDYSIIFAYVGTAIFAVSYVQIALWSLTCERQTHKIRKHFFNAVLHQEIGWFDKHQSGELTSRLADDMERLREGMGDKIAICLQFVSQFFAGFGIGFWKSWELTLVIMSLTPLLALCGGFMAKMISTFATKEQESYAKAGSIAEEVLSCIRTVISFGGEQKEVKRYEGELTEAKDVGIKKGAITATGIGLTMLIIFSAYALAFWYGPKMVMDGKISGGEVLTVFFCVMIGSFSLGNIGPSLSTVATALGAAATLFDIIDKRPTIDARKPEGKRLKTLVGNITLKDVFFKYPTRKDVPVLQGVSLRVQTGQTVALVGSSGCGKSTVINLLQRFYDVDDGQIYIDDEEIHDLNIKWLRSNIGVVSQEPILFGCTIYENIEYGREGVTKEQIMEAAKKANAHDFISKLPKGYNTLVGERGAQLSGGQKQRVAIARALVRDPTILLLDEATSALDSESEAIVQDALDKVAQEGRTTIVIAHRLSTIRNADIIYTFDEGKVVESGNHEELMKQNGVYKQLVTLQMLGTTDFQGGEDDEASKVEASKVEEAKDRVGSLSAVASPSKQMKRQLSRQRSRMSSMSSKVSDTEEEIEEEEVPEASYKEILKLNAPEWPYIAFGTFWSAVLGITMPVFALIFSEVISTFSLIDDPVQMKEEARFWSCMFLVLGIVTGLSNFFNTGSFTYSGEYLTLRLRKRAFWTILRQDVSYFDDPRHNTGALATRLSTDASNVKGATGIRIGSSIQSVVTLVAAVVIAFVFGWKLALLVFAAVPLLAMSGAVQMKLLQGNKKRDSELLEDAGKIAAEGIENVRTVASLGLEGRLYRDYCEKLEMPFSQGQKNTQFYGISYALSQGMIFWIYAAAFRLGGYLVYKDEMMPDEVFKVVFGVAFAGVSLGQSTAFLPDFAKAKHSASLLIHMFNTEPKIDNYSTKGAQPPSLTGEITYSNIEFEYPTRPDIKVLRGLNLKVKPGQTVALVGESGCGKSTLVSLLERFYDVSAGDIKMDGKDIRELNVGWLRANMSIVSQEPVLFACSIRDNINYSVDRTLSQEEVEAVAKMANIHDFIVGLPLGYDTLVGEKGTQLSGGQKQRVAIARALARNPKILLLDEATSALDTESEKVVQMALDRAMEGRTCIIIAHRISTIQNADSIAVVRDGIVVEQGSHNELLSKEGHYYTITGGQRKAAEMLSEKS
ncbi:Multidrug resistance protein 1 [Holothuria leucospilota]|uniref:Multidrug resistance protein 1 n=1 Tax=Holothuria leucospilota TaxID=206669 RepID=A0A9Q0YFP4_HOLLE|nr:Multidrug resistance protein 1 [Holothuria leucospilota]